MSNNTKSQPKYKVLNRAELHKIEDSKKSLIDSSYIIEYNGGFVTIFKDKTSMIIPPILGGDEGLFFNNVEDMNNMIDSRKYPVKGNNSFWEKEKDRVLNFANEMPYYCFRLTEMLNFDVKITDDKLYLKELSEVITKKLRVERRTKLELHSYITIYIGELIRQKVDGEWRLLPQYALNTYYRPEITKDDRFCSHWGFIVGQLEMVSFIPVDIESLINKACVFHPIGNRSYISKWYIH